MTEAAVAEGEASILQLPKMK